MRFEPMSAREVSRYVARAADEYADGLQASSQLDRAASIARARQIIDEARRSRDHAMCSIEEGGRSVGTVWFGPPPDGSGTLYIWEVSIAPELRGRGLGREAVELVVEEASRRQLAGVRLNVFASNGPARRLYERCGFVGEERSDGNILMTKWLR